MRYEQFAKYYTELFPFNLQQGSFISEYITADSSILELGCGCGDMSGYLSDKCKAITAIDGDSQMIKEAIDKYPNIDFHTMQLEELARLPGRFDTIFSFGNTLSYLSQSSLIELFTTIYNKLIPGGKWILHIINWDFFNGKTEYSFPVKTAQGLTLNRSYKFNDNGTAEFTLELTSNTDGCFSDTHTLYPLPCQRYIELNLQAGLTLTGSYLNWTKEPWQPDKNGGIILTFNKNE